ncbi:hypothetical protein [Sphingobacterium sp. UGAL515B_05]|uniref:hypothetical protein n=1 Tax=Sphingobacterium sp. UGAL515B_05 TaxID=2986767 RepID=UPI0029530917|nr:hypothetical protein [Sphingobacterium sp. UGAL515B_05]WON93092.1 hypothetical protein OK025_17780 [Sphingobacterium sp. UGAL515B_05]
MKRVFVILSILLVSFLIAAFFIKVNKRETLLYKIQQWVTYDTADWENYEHNKLLLAAGSTEVTTTEVAAVEDEDDLYPVDTNRISPEFRALEIEKIRKSDFGQLVIAKLPPDHEDAQIALIHLTNRKLTDVIINQKINIKVGTCFENPKTAGNYRCVSCMILLYNRAKKSWVEAPNGENFLKNAYDFYQASEGDIWQARDLSMRIPYDYALVEKYSK